VVIFGDAEGALLDIEDLVFAMVDVTVMIDLELGTRAYFPLAPSTPLLSAPTLSTGKYG
jgi:hypothetical protein